MLNNDSGIESKNYFNESGSDKESSSESDSNKESSSESDSNKESSSESDSDSLSKNEYDSDSDEEFVNDYDYKVLPKMLVKIKFFLKKQNIIFSKKTLDGRINSSLDEDNIIAILKNSKYSKYIILPEMKRCWYDIVVCDEIYGKIPVNIKTTTMENADNVGNLAIVVQAYTNYNLNLKEKCDNGKASKILYKYLKEDKININIKKDYFFLVFNKNNKNDIYINSVLGLKFLTRNNNNLPFQVKWNDNKKYELTSIYDKVEMFKKTIKGKLPWKIEFLLNMNKL